MILKSRKPVRFPDQVGSKTVGEELPFDDQVEQVTGEPFVAQGNIAICASARTEAVFNDPFHGVLRIIEGNSGHDYRMHRADLATPKLPSLVILNGIRVIIRGYKAPYRKFH